jgi:hypothetical protein
MVKSKCRGGNQARPARREARLAEVEAFCSVPAGQLRPKYIRKTAQKARAKSCPPSLFQGGADLHLERAKTIDRLIVHRLG